MLFFQFLSVFSFFLFQTTSKFWLSNQSKWGIRKCVSHRSKDRHDLIKVDMINGSHLISKCMVIPPFGGEEKYVNLKRRRKRRKKERFVCIPIMPIAWITNGDQGRSRDAGIGKRLDVFGDPADI